MAELHAGQSDISRQKRRNYHNRQQPGGPEHPETQ